MKNEIKDFYTFLQEEQEKMEAERIIHENNPYWLGKLREAQTIYDRFIEIFELPF